MDIFFIGGDNVTPVLPIERVGSKAANLARLDRIGLRVPPAFVIGTSVCRDVLSAGGRLPDNLKLTVRDAMARLERATHRRFGGRLPLLVSVRSSPPVSMPGMLDTVLNIGLTDTSIRGLLRTTGNPALVWDTSRRFAQGFAETVRGCPPGPFNRTRDAAVAGASAQTINEMDPLMLRDLARETAQLARTLSGAPLPDDPYAQLEAAIEAVFRSWTMPRAVEYRRLNDVDAASGTGVIVQTMVFGNGHAASGSGVGFTRNPSTGADELYVDFLSNAQGEDVVAGRHSVTETSTLSATLPDIDDQLHRAKHALEAEFLDMQDFEFTVQDGQLYFLQSRAGKRTPWAALHIATNLVRAGLITPDEGLKRLGRYDVESIRRVRLMEDADVTILGTATPASLGVATGAIAFDCVRAQALAATQPVILVRPEMNTEDVSGLATSVGILTAVGGRTSHAAVVARQLGKVCLVGCSSLSIDEARRRCSFGTHSFPEGAVITLDGETGRVYAGVVPVVTERPEAALAEIRRWQTAVRVLSENSIDAIPAACFERGLDVDLAAAVSR